MTQKELKNFYIAELWKAWQDKKMVDHCTKSAAFIIEHKDKFYTIDKPTIETNFCFGYGLYGSSTEEEEAEAEATAEAARKSEEYFMSRNLNPINEQIEKLTKIREEMRLNWAKGSHPRYMIATGAQYYGQPEDCKLYYYSVVDTFGGRINGEICEDITLIDKLITGYEQVKQDFTKRLKTYLKRHGTSKIKTWSYLRD